VVDMYVCVGLSGPPPVRDCCMGGRG
jgi:hypothetical protein